MTNSTCLHAFGYSRNLASAMALLFLAAGCTTAKIADYQPAASSVSERTTQQSGVEIALDPFVERSRAEKYFDMDAIAKGVAILHVRITNRTLDKTFLVQKKGIHLVPNRAGAAAVEADEMEPQNTDHKAMNITTTTLYAIGTVSPATLVLGVGFGLAGAANTSHSSEIQRNLADKELPDQTLSPGQSMEGFIYFSPVQKGEDWSRTTFARIDLTNTMTQQATELTIPLSQ